jgi:hypothetical protein
MLGSAAGSAAIDTRSGMRDGAVKMRSAFAVDDRDVVGCIAAGCRGGGGGAGATNMFDH